MKYTIAQVNDFTMQQCMDTFSNVIEHCPKFAKVIYERKPFSSANDFILTLYSYIDSMENEEKQSMLTHHPDLSGKLEESSTKESREEQSGAELQTLTVEERDLLLELNSRYISKFGFPFVICARENNYHSIIHVLEERLNYSQDEEIDNGIGEVKKISILRILDIIS